MKKLLAIFLFLPFIAYADSIPVELKGEPLLSSPKFIEEINCGCLYLLDDEEPTEEERKNCSYYQLNFYWTQLLNKMIIPFNQKHAIIENNEGEKLSLEIIEKPSVGTYMFLYLETAVHKSSILVNASIYGDGYESQKIYYYLDADDLYIMQFTISEEGFKGDYWRKYKINFTAATFDLIESISCKDKRDASGEIIYTQRESTIRECRVDTIANRNAF